MQEHPGAPDIRVRRWPHLLLTAIITASVGFSIYVWQQATINQLKTELSETQSELQRERGFLDEKLSLTYTYNIPEISMWLTKVPVSLEGLIYKLVNKGEVITVRFSSSAMSKYCTITNTTAPLGTLFRRFGEYGAVAEDSQAGLVKQLDGYYVTYQKPARVCAADDKGDILQLQNIQVPLLQSALASIEEK